MGIFKWLKKPEKQTETNFYNEEEINELEAYIKTNFGEFTEVYHEIVSLDIHLDLAILPPTQERNYYRLVTMGMGAYRMNVPSALDDYELNYAELMIDLPADWKLQSDDENDYWPLRWLKTVARLPLESNTWVGYGHTIAAGENHETLAANNYFEGVGLIHAMNLQGEEAKLRMSSKKLVRFYRMIALYGAELDYKQQCEDIEPLLKRFDTKDQTFIVDIHRKNYGLLRKE